MQSPRPGLAEDLLAVAMPGDAAAAVHHIAGVTETGALPDGCRGTVRSTATASPASPPARRAARWRTRRRTPRRSSTWRATATDAGVALAVFPGTRHLRLRDQRPAAAVHAAGRGGSGHRHHRRRIGRTAAAAAGRRAAAPCRRAVQLRGGDPPRPPARRGAEGPPAELPRVLRAAAFRRAATAWWAARSPSARTPRRSAPTCCSPPRICPASSCTPRSARTSGSRSRPVRRRRWPARRCWPTCPPATSPSARRRRAGCCAHRSPPAASRPICTPPRAPANPPPTSPGTARPRSSRTATRWPRPSASRPPASSRVADIDLDLLRHERMQMGSFDTNRRRNPATFRRIGFRLDPPPGDIGLERRIERYPFVPADPRRLEQDCYEAYNIQVSGLTQRLRATGIKRVVIGVSGGLDSTQALIVCAQCARPARPAARQYPCLYDAGLRHLRRTPRPTRSALMQALGVTWRGAGYPSRRRTHAGRHRASRSRAANRSTT